MNETGICEVLKELGCQSIKLSGDHVRANCPFAPYLHDKGTDRHPSFLVKIEPDEKSCYHCFSCNSRGTFLGLLYELIRCGKNIDDELLEKVRLAERQDPIDKCYKRQSIYNKEFLIGVKRHKEEVWSEEEYAPFAGKAHKYIIDRGVSVDTCRIWEIGYDPEKRRVMFPVRRYQDGALVGCVGRTVDKHVEPTYLTYFNFKKSNFLYGEHLLKDENQPIIGEALGYDLPAQDGVILVEGMMDVLKLCGMGYENVVGLMTSNVSKRQVQKLKKVGRDIYLMMDWDKAGVMGRENATRSLFGKQPVFDVPGVTVCSSCGSRWSRVGKTGDGRIGHICRKCGKPWVTKEGKKDPDSLADEEIIDCLKNAKRIEVSS